MSDAAFNLWFGFAMGAFAGVWVAVIAYCIFAPRVRR